MTTIFKLASILLFVLLVSLRPVANKVVTKWVVQKSSTLKINGSSNVNKFQCGIEGYYRPDTISFTSAASREQVALQGRLAVDVLSLDCNNKLITKDLRKTLKATEHPQLVIKFVALERVPAYGNGNTDVIKVCIEVELAGCCKRFEMPFTITRSANSVVELKGTKEFCFSDFQLTPPKKIGGLVRVNNSFTVNFHLVVSQITYKA